MKNSQEIIKITLQSFDHYILNKAMNEIIATVRRTGARIKGPISMPTKIRRFCVIRGPHVDKDSREHFEIQSSKKILIIVPGSSTVDSLMKLNLSAGVSVKISINSAN